MKKVFLTFAASKQYYINCCKNLVNVIKGTQIFDDVINLDDNYLKNDKEFWDVHGEFIMNNDYERGVNGNPTVPPGYGKWLWKPYIIKKTIENMNDGDILLYADARCELRNKNKLINLFEDVKKDLIIGSHGKDSWRGKPNTEKRYSKMDLIIKLEANIDKIINTKQREAGCIMFLICDKTRKLINEWYETGCDYHMIDDTKSININYKEFSSHKHDQSIFSILTKKYNIFSNKQIQECMIYHI